MKVSQVTMTLVEHEGRRWLVGEDGVILATPDREPGPCQAAEAVEAVRGALGAEQRTAEFVAEANAEREFMARWDKAFERMLKAANASRWRGSESNDAWSRRIDASTTAIYLMVKRGSNLKEGMSSVQRFGTWERMLAVAYQRSMQWNDGDEWDAYSGNLSSNVRKRFRNADPCEPGSPSDRRHEQEEGRSGDAERPGVQVLFDWR